MAELLLLLLLTSQGEQWETEGVSHLSASCCSDLQLSHLSPSVVNNRVIPLWPSEGTTLWLH